MDKVDEGMLRAAAIPASDVAWIVAKAKHSEECRRHLGGAQTRITELETALRGILPYAENEVAAIGDLADDGDEEAQREVDEATAAMEAAQTALGIV